MQLTIARLPYVGPRRPIILVVQSQSQMRFPLSHELLSSTPTLNRDFAYLAASIQRKGMYSLMKPGTAASRDERSLACVSQRLVSVSHSDYTT